MNNSEFYIGQVFNGQYSPYAAVWCNHNNAYIKELEPSGGTRRFQILEVPEPSDLDKYKSELRTYEQYLTDTDWYVVRYVDNGISIPDDVKTQRQEAREAIDRLRILISELEA